MRRLVGSIVFLLIGAVVNIAVAWALAASVRVQDSSMKLAIIDMPDGGVCGVWMRSGPGYGLIHWGDVLDRARAPRWAEGWNVRDPETILLPRWSRFRASPGPLVEPVFAYFEESRGWPMAALSSGTSYANVNERLVETTDHAIVIGNWPPGSSRMSPRARALPYAVIWPGFLVNSAFYAAACWVMAAAPGAIRRGMRKRRGLCAHCAYPAGASEVCTECGRPVTTSKRAGKSA